VAAVNDPDLLRIGTQERDEALQVLGEHFAQGRLPVAEYDERVAKALGAETRADLRPLFADLPFPHPPVLAPPAPMPAVMPIMAYPPAMPRSTAVVPASGRYRAVAGVLQLFLPFGIGRFYTGHNSMAVAQLLLSFVGVGVIWCLIDGIILLARGGTDADGNELRW
jgi:TM2 domain-containing membrane protein YozV